MYESKWSIILHGSTYVSGKYPLRFPIMYSKRSSYAFHPVTHLKVPDFHFEDKEVTKSTSVQHAENVDKKLTIPYYAKTVIDDLPNIVHLLVS